MRSSARCIGWGSRSGGALELNAGIVEGQWTPLAARQMSWVIAHLSPQEGEVLFHDLGGMQPSKSSLDRLPKRLSARWETGREGFEAQLREAHAVSEEAATLAPSSKAGASSRLGRCSPKPTIPRLHNRKTS